MKNLFIFLSFLMLHLAALAQRQWSLQECISHAVANSLTVKRSELNVRQQEIALSTSRNSRLPDLSGSMGENFSFGRALTADNTYANRNTQSTSFSLSTSVPLITGGRIPADIRVKRLNLEAALQDCERARESVTLSVISSYLEAVYQKDMVAVSERQLALSAAQLHRMQLLFENSKASEAELAQVRAMHASDETQLTQQHNSYMLALLTLSQLLELETPEGFDVAQPIADNAADIILPTPEAVYSESLGLRPQIAADQLRLKSAERSVALARASYFPSLYLSAGIGTSYYKTSGLRGMAFGRQMQDNFNQHVGLSLSVPIFQRFTTRNNVRSARLQVQSQQIQLDETRKQLFKDIQQSFYNALASQRQCISSDAALASSRTAFELMERRYENGKANATEYEESRTKLLKAESDALQARYTFMFRRYILEFYRR